MDQEFVELFQSLPQSGCAKRQVAAGIWVGTASDRVFLVATNFCQFEGDKCPRIGLPSGAGYELCQAQHAEANLAKLIKIGGHDLQRKVCWVVGHYYACEPCAKALKEIGIEEIRVREVPGITSSAKRMVDRGPGC